MASCPNCGFNQPDDDYCANCGIDMSSYVSKRSLLDLLKEPVAYVVLLFLAVGISSSFIYTRIKEHILEQKGLELSNSKTYENLVEVSPPVVPTFTNNNEPSTELSSAEPQSPIIEPEVFDSGKLNIYYVSLSRTSPILTNARMTSTNVGTIANLSSYLTPESAGTINIVNMDSWSVPANAGRVIKIFNITRKLPDSENSSGLNLRLEVEEISPEFVTLTGGTTFVSVEAIPNVQNQPIPNDTEDISPVPTTGEINTEEVLTTTDEDINDPAGIQPSMTVNTSTNSISSDRLNLSRGDALLISGIIPRRELSLIEADLMPNLIARFMLQREFIVNNRDFVVFVEYSSL